ncbi:MAG: hypothetical protein J0L78_16255 [Planctomycetes bacterium]|nr:hypothetical protein [Planctomycetota bacterium]
MQVRQSTKVRPAVTTALILAAGLSSVSCDRADPHQHALASGSAKLQANSGGAFAAPYESVQKKNYQDTIEIAKPVASLEEKSPQSAAASALVGTAQLGKAQSLLDEAAVMEQAAIGRATLLRVSLDNWIAYSFSADTAQGFDPTDVLARIDADRAERDREVQALQSKLQDVERRLADLRSRSKSKFEEAEKFAVEYAKARESLATLSASEAESRLASARDERRKGDAIRVEASRLQAQADVTQPEADELKVLIIATQNRIASLDREKLEINERAQQGRAAAAQSRSSAAETAKQIETGLADLASARNSGVIAKYDEAIAALRTAATSAKAASADATAGGKVLVGRTQLALAGALAAKASSLKSYSSFLHQFAAANPPLPFAAALEAPQKDAAEQIRIATDDAKAAFEAAQSAFSSVQLRGQGAAAIKDRMTQLAEAIGALAGQSAAVPPPPAEASPESAQPATPAPEAATPTAAAAPDAGAAWGVIYVAMEAGNFEALKPLTRFTDPSHEGILSSLMVVARATEEIDAACKEKFGKSMSDAVAVAQGTTSPTASDFKVEVAGTEATVSHPSQPAQIKLVLIENQWLLDSGSLANGPAAMAAAMSGQITGAAKSVTDDVRAGKFATVEEVFPAFQKRIMGGGGGG